MCVSAADAEPTCDVSQRSRMISLRVTISPRRSVRSVSTRNSDGVVCASNDNVYNVGISNVNSFYVWRVYVR